MNTIFFSWQSDRPSREGESLIEEALAIALAVIGDDNSIDINLRKLIVDRDTKNTPGQPSVADTIFKKISNAAIFVPDLTFVGQRVNGRKMPNPNVLVEYGWALKHMTNSRILPIMNAAHGQPDEVSIQFDMRHLRWPIVYSCPDNATDEERGSARDDLAKKLEEQIRIVLKSGEYKASIPKPAEPQRYSPKTAVFGNGRYRSTDEALGMNYSPLRFDHRYPVTLMAGPVIWLRVLPFYDPGTTWNIADIEREATGAGKFLMPLSYLRPDSCGWLHAPDGFGVYSISDKGPGKTGSVVHVFESGEIWTIDAEALTIAENNGRPVIPLNELENDIHALVRQYAEFLIRLGIRSPFRWVIGIENTKDRALYLPHGRAHAPWAAAGYCLVNEIITDGTWTPGQSLDEALRPLINKVCNSCGVDPKLWQR